MKPEILFDVSRLLWSADRKTPTGIDRVELVQALHFLDTAVSRLHFTASTPWHRLGYLPTPSAARFLHALKEVWDTGNSRTGTLANILARRLRRSLITHSHETALCKRLRRLDAPVIYLLVSHHHLDRPELIARLTKRTGARFVALIHDTIPLHFPEYARPGQPKRHARRMETVSKMADGIIHNSVSTMEMFAPFLEMAGRHVPQVVAHLGIELPLAPPEPIPQKADPPLFVYIGTIEPRKNHLLLLHLWRQMAAMKLPVMPRLVLIGRRGWENENIIDILERCEAVRPFVEEHNELPDNETQRILSNACAFLMPSFAEGYGLPLAEALALGVPALCSDLAPLREIGGDVPEYLNPLDGPAWQNAILDYATRGSPRREAQLQRLRAWHPPQWQQHLEAVETLLDQVAGSASTVIPLSRSAIIRRQTIGRLFPRSS